MQAAEQHVDSRGEGQELFDGRSTHEAEASCQNQLSFTLFQRAAGDEDETTVFATIDAAVSFGDSW